MNSDFERIAAEHGDRLKIIPVERLKELREIIGNFKEQEELNDFQSWIVNKLYRYEIPENGFTVNSIILVAVHHPFYAKVDFHRNGIKRTFLSLVSPDLKKTEAYLRKLAAHKGYSIKKAKNLPMKRLGVHSGLAEYGRNNITYVSGLGSNFSYTAYFSDILCEKDTWGDIKNAELCQNCSLCMESCPTGAIRKDRFLIDNQKCLSCVNEVPGEFPGWIPETAHHTLYDCLVCQRVCPMNHRQKDDVIEGVSFTEEETEMLLTGKPINTFSKDFKSKVYMLGIDDWYAAIPRNLKTLFELKK